MTILFRSEASEHAQHASRTHTAVHLLRWDDVFQEWDHEASFRLWWRAELAAKALSAGDPKGTYAVVDGRPTSSTAIHFFRDGCEVKQPEHTMPYTEA